LRCGRELTLPKLLKRNGVKMLAGSDTPPSLPIGASVVLVFIRNSLCSLPLDCRRPATGGYAHDALARRTWRIRQLGEAESVTSFAFKCIVVRAAMPYGTRRVKVATDGEIV
jgi:hypothetical protein